MQIGERHLKALLDSGSEASFVNEPTAELARQQGCASQEQPTAIRLANGASLELPGSVLVQLRYRGQTYEHWCHIMPQMTSKILIGIDLWAKLGISMPAPPPPSPKREIEQDTTTTRETCATETERLRNFLARELPKFNAIHGPTDQAQHHIRVKNVPPIKQRYRPRNPAMQKIIDDEIAEMEKAGVIEPSRSAWSSPVVIVKKKDGKHRFCIDFRKVNSVTERDAYPLPQVTATLDKLRGAKYISTIDLKSGYWQIPLTPASRPITAFTIPGRGLMQFTVMPSLSCSFLSFLSS